jgi:hypothetical protein
VTGPHPPPPSASPGVVPGDPLRDPGPQEPEDPNQPSAAPGIRLPLQTATPAPGPAPAPPLPVPTLP